MSAPFFTSPDLPNEAHSELLRPSVPYIALPLVQHENSLTRRLRTVNSGATRFGNLIIGLAVDGARYRGVSPERIACAFAVGEVAAHATFTYVEAEPWGSLDSVPDTPYAGNVEIHGPELVVAGGDPADEPEAVVHFVKLGDVYAPRRTAWRGAGSSSLDVLDLPIPFDYRGGGGAFSEVPPEFKAVERLAELEETVTAGSPSTFIPQGNITNL